jgi:hypothetical protein
VLETRIGSIATKIRVVELVSEWREQTNDRYLFEDLEGKGSRISSVAAIDSWSASSDVAGLESNVCAERRAESSTYFWNTTSVQKNKYRLEYRMIIVPQAQFGSKR